VAVASSRPIQRADGSGTRYSLKIDEARRSLTFTRHDSREKFLMHYTESPEGTLHLVGAIGTITTEAVLRKQPDAPSPSNFRFRWIQDGFVNQPRSSGAGRRSAAMLVISCTCRFQSSFARSSHEFSRPGFRSTRTPSASRVVEVGAAHGSIRRAIASLTSEPTVDDRVHHRNVFFAAAVPAHPVLERSLSSGHPRKAIEDVQSSG